MPVAALKQERTPLETKGAPSPAADSAVRDGGIVRNLREDQVGAVETNTSSKALQAIADCAADILATRPVGVIHRLDKTVAIFPWGQGFPILISQFSGQSSILVEFGGWHEDSLTPEVAMKLVRDALNGKVRVIDTTLNGKPWRHVAEIMGSNGKWKWLGEISFMRFALFRKEVSTELRQYEAGPVSDE